jgi:hypothetical protein
LADIFEEVAADLRAERARTLLLRYGKFLAAAAIGVVIAAGAWQGLAWWRARQLRTVATAYFAAMQVAGAANPAGGANAKAEADFARLTGNNTPAGYRSLARLRAAALAAQGGQTKLALTLWQDLAHDPNADPLLAGLARLLWVTHQIDALKPGSNAGPLEAELRPLLAAGDPWQPMAREAVALIAIARGDKAAAKKALTELSGDPSAPQGLRARAGALLARLAE